MLGAAGGLWAPPDKPADAHPDGILLIGVGMDGQNWSAPVSRRTMLGAGLAIGAAGGFRTPVRQTEIDPRHLTGLFEQIRRLCQQASPQAVLPTLFIETNRLHRLASAGYPSGARELRSIAAYFALYLGKMFQEAGSTVEAVRWTRTAELWAEQGDDPSLPTRALIRRAMLALYQDRGSETIALAQAAQAVPGMPARLLGMAALREALGHARLGDDRACGRSLDRAADKLTSEVRAAADDLEPSDVSDHLAMTTAWCRHDLGDPRAAAELLDAQMATVCGSARRTRARFGTRRALAHAVAGETDHSCDLMWELLPDIEDTASATVEPDVREVARVLGRRRNHRRVKLILPEINAVLVSLSQRTGVRHAKDLY